jgi:hypothetical protein
MPLDFVARILLGSDSTSQTMLAEHRAQLGALAASHRDLQEAFNDLGATPGVLANSHSDLTRALLGQRWWFSPMLIVIT